MTDDLAQPSQFKAGEIDEAAHKSSSLRDDRDARAADSDVTSIVDGSYRFGIEEEYFLADATTRGTPRRAAAAFHAAVHAQLPVVQREFLQSQLEVASPPFTDFADARAVLAGLRAGLAAIGREHGIQVLASGTHPLARWSRQVLTATARYERLMRELRILGQRNVVCGMHVHVEVPRPEARVDLMNRLLPFTAPLLALSVSSPFWQGQDTGLAGYRLSAFGEMPRTGLPDLFEDEADFARYVAVMTRSGSIKDASYLWWTLRPSLKYPTLELRVADACTRLDDTITIAALFRCLVRLASRRPELNRHQTGTDRAIAAENLWRAQRDGVLSAMVDPATGEAVPFGVSLEALLTLVAEDADALGCAAEVQAARQIAAGGTSANRQKEVFAAARKSGADVREALRQVVDWLSETTSPKD